MTIIQTTGMESRSDPRSGNKDVLQDLPSVISALQSFVAHGEPASVESLKIVLPVLQQAQKTLLLSAEEQRVNSTKTTAAAQETGPLQTLLDILPVGIVIVHDLEDQEMTINRTGLQILNLPSDKNTFTDLFEGSSLPFKFFRGGKELSAEEFPIQLAITQNMPLGNIEMDVQHSTGKMINLIVYAAPLYDNRGEISGSLGVMVDITTRKLIEQRLGMQYAIAHILAESNTINRAAPQVMQMICETAHWEYGALWQAEEDMTTLTNKGVWFDPNTSLAEYADKARYSLLLQDDKALPWIAVKGEEPVWMPNLNQVQSPYAEEIRKAGLRSAYLLPVRSGKSIIAVLECLSNQPQIHDVHLVDMLEAVGNQVGIFLERKVLEEALTLKANQQRLLADAGIALSTSVNLEKRLQNITHLIVPEIADWCAIDTIDQNNVLRRIAATHVDSTKEDLLFQIQPTREIDFNGANNRQIQTLLTGQSMVFPELPFSIMEESYTDPHILETIRRLNPISSVVVPLIAHDQILGLVTFVYSDSGRRYASSDLPLAEDIVRRTALAVDNALLYSESQKLNSELEQRVDKRTAQLRMAIDELRKQVIEREKAEEEIRILNQDLEQRIAQRTYQLEVLNTDLQNELKNRMRTSEALKASLRRTQELYRISKTIGIVKSPGEVLRLLLSSSYLRAASRASIGILDQPWMKDGPPPQNCFILAEWNKEGTLPNYTGKQITLEEYGVTLPVPYGQAIVILDIQSVMGLPERVRTRFAELKTHSLIILPLIAGGEWYGLLSLHFKTRHVTNMEDLRHVGGLVDEAAIVIKNMRLLETESLARQEAEKANALKLKFLGMVSHELRTPLTSIKGFATTLLADDVEWPAEKQKEFIETINEESDKLHDLIEQLLDLSRMEAGILRILPLQVSFERIIESAQPQLLALSTEHRLRFNISAGLPLIMADRERIAQVITNLVNNAVKFSPPQTEILISAYPQGQDIRVDVSDQGSGIPAADRERVFTAFRQLENGSGNRTKGAGLGLAICKGLVEAHKGRIWIADHEGPGTVISFTLPTVESKDVDLVE